MQNLPRYVSNIMLQRIKNLTIIGKSLNNTLRSTFICIKERLGLAEKIDNRPPKFGMTIPVHMICKVVNSSLDEQSIDRICEK
jgi:hypothetical protein